MSARRLRLAVLASGSSGNACLIQSPRGDLLIDVGLSPRRLAHRMAAVGANWSNTRGVLLTHLHADHWRPKTANWLRQKGIPLYCHADHLPDLRAGGWPIRALEEANLIRLFEAGVEFETPVGLTVQAAPLNHDGGATFGFRVEDRADPDSRSAIAYLADLGTWDERLVEFAANVDLLAIEFNHDVTLQKNSGRPPQLIERVLGDQGHLSNEQASAFLTRAALASTRVQATAIVALHLSRCCNTSELARAAARGALLKAQQQAIVHIARQDESTPLIHVGQEASLAVDSPAKELQGRLFD